jgi:hypothetical protein
MFISTQRWPPCFLNALHFGIKIFSRLSMMLETLHLTQSIKPSPPLAHLAHGKHVD